MIIFFKTSGLARINRRKKLRELGNHIGAVTFECRVGTKGLLDFAFKLRNFKSEYIIRVLQKYSNEVTALQL